MKRIATTILLLLVGGAAGWGLRLAQTDSSATHRPHAEAAGQRKVLYYQSSMHPWVKSDRPGNCTVCGMALVPVYEGQPGHQAAPGVVMLPANHLNVIGIQTALVTRRPVERSLRVAGMITDNETRLRRLSAYVPGRIEKLHANFVGVEIAKDQPLVTLYSPPLLEAEREYAILYRQSQMNHSTKITEEHARLLAATRAKLLQLGLTPAQIDALPKKPDSTITSDLVAPMAGTVVRQLVYEGQYVKEGDMLFEIGDFFTMWFQFALYENDLPLVQAGQMVEVTTPGLPGRVFKAPVTFVDPNLDPRTRSARVRVELANPTLNIQGRKVRHLKRQMYAEGLMTLRLTEALCLPREAVLDTGNRTVVYVDHGGGAYEMRHVTIGARGDAFWEITHGLEPGDRVVTMGNLLLDGQAQINQMAVAQ